MKCSPLEPMIKTAAFFIASFVLAGLLAACDKKKRLALIQPQATLVLRQHLMCWPPVTYGMLKT
jgi:hypothetical protein